MSHFWPKGQNTSTLTSRERFRLDGAQEGVDEWRHGIQGAAHQVQIVGLRQDRLRYFALRPLGGRLGRAETQQQGCGTGPHRSAEDVHRVCCERY